MFASLILAAPPLISLLVLLWLLDRYAGRSGALLVLALFWGGMMATGIVLSINALWLEQPEWYGYIVSPISEECAKASLFLVLVALRLVRGATVGTAYGMASGIGFAIWENAAYFEGGDVSLWFYVTRSWGTALLHASSTAVVGAVVGAAAGARRGKYRLAIGILLSLLALAFSIFVHGAWNYVCLVLINTSPYRRALPLVAVILFFAFLTASILRERWFLRREILEIWKEKTIDDPVAQATVSPRPLRALKKLGILKPGKLYRSLLVLARSRLDLENLPPTHKKRSEIKRFIETQKEEVRALASNKKSGTSSRSSIIKHAPLAVLLAVATISLIALGHMSPVPSTFARRTIVMTSKAKVRPEPQVTLIDGDAYVLWQKGPSKAQRKQFLSWLSKDGSVGQRILGTLPENRDAWFELSALGKGIAVATREDDQIWLRSFEKSEQTGELRFEARESTKIPCWPWLTSDRGKTIISWDRLRKAAWLGSRPLSVGKTMSIPDPFPGPEAEDRVCIRGQSLADSTLHQMSRTGKVARMASLDLNQKNLTPVPIQLCPGKSNLRIHSLDKDRGRILVLLGSKGSNGYDLYLVILSRSGQITSPCRHLRNMPAGEPMMVTLAGNDDDGFLAWSTFKYILLTRLPLNEKGSRERRWVLDEAPEKEFGVVRLGVSDDKLYIVWEGASEGGRWSLKLLRTQISDL